MRPAVPIGAHQPCRGPARLFAALAQDDVDIIKALGAEGDLGGGLAAGVIGAPLRRCGADHPPCRVRDLDDTVFGVVIGARAITYRPHFQTVDAQGQTAAGL